MNNFRKKSGLSTISEVLAPFAKKTIGKHGFIEVEIILNWRDIVGEDLANYSNPQKISFLKGERSNGNLHMEVPSGAFALELQHKEKIIIEKINVYFGYNAVSKLSISQNIDMNISKIDIDTKQDKKTLVTKEEENYIKEVVNDLENPKLKAVLEKLGTNIISSNKEKQDN